ncbi:glycosyltransferase [Pseudomonas sp. TH43]|uniref:glycosyltransferase n=1 Tax=Pseudomonas sp. TH43 TaxID=2796407 RepID=UPI0019121A85|nr:glycosyltransferase [Pseudomonas sp. TH43]MBK5373264.1 glycosyltransferase [Pseudomonas sp. TH43]
MKISIITTTYNCKDYIEDCINSVQMLRLEPLAIKVEHVIYDDASTDGTREVIESKMRPDITFIGGIYNVGPSAGRNIAIQRSSGDFIFVLDGDDLILQRTIYNFAQTALEHKDTKWFVSGFICVDSNLRYKSNYDYYAWQFKSKLDLLAAIFRGSHYIQHSVLFKKELFQKVGGYLEHLKMAEDLDLFVRFILSGAMPVYLNSISHLHRFHESNLSAGIDKHTHALHAAEIQDRYKSQVERLLEEGC